MYDRTTINRFWAKVNIPSDGNFNDCWKWTGALSSKGYGIFYIQYKPVRSHRFAYQLTRKYIPNGMCVCHSCDNPACCNPLHLWLGTIADNNLDKARKHRSAKTYKSNRGIDFYIICRMWQSGLSQAEIARRLKISNQYVSKIVNGKTPQK